jgi:hypothetical protein
MDVLPVSSPAAALGDQTSDNAATSTTSASAIRKRTKKEIAIRVFQPPQLHASLTVSIVVGTILNLINSLDKIIDGTLIVWKIALTFIVPFLVSSYGAYSANVKGCT